MTTTTTRADAIEIPINEIERSPFQAREDFNEEALRALADSLAENKMLQPVGIRAADSKGPKRWQLIWGERRLRAAQLVGWETVPAVVLRADDTEALLLAADENLNRQDLNPIETATVLSMLYAPDRIGPWRMSYETIAKRFGRKGSWARKLCSLLTLPAEWQRRVASGDVPTSTGYMLTEYAKSPNILSAAQEDMDANPELWRSAKDVAERLAFIAGRFEALEEGSRLLAGNSSRRHRLDNLRGKSESDAHNPKPGAVKSSLIARERVTKRIAGILTPFKDDLKTLIEVRIIVTDMIDDITELPPLKSELAAS